MKIELGDTLYEYSPWTEPEEDNRKIFHDVKVNGKISGHIDLSPYVQPTYRTFELSCLFHFKFGRFPNRTDVNSYGPLQQEPRDKLIAGELVRDVFSDIDFILDKVLYDKEVTA